VHERLHDPKLLAVALRELAYAPLQVEVEALRKRRRLAEAVDVPQMCEVGQELVPGQAVVERELPGEVPDPPPDRDAVAVRVEPEDFDATRGRADEVEQQAYGRRLAGPVGAEEPKDFARLHLEVDVDDAAEAPVVLGESFGANDGGHA
jgi:hypothetical protein